MIKIVHEQGEKNALYLKKRGYKTMKNTVNELKPREKAAIIAIAEKAVANGLTRKDAIKVIAQKMVTMGIVEKSGAYNQMLSVAISFYCVALAKKEGKKPIEGLKSYATFKKACGLNLNDFGAFGDTIETCIRVFSKPANLVNWSDLHVKRQSEVDITIKGVKMEVGNNGKTFLESDENNPMNGKYQKIIYGVFTKAQQENIYRLLIIGNYEEAKKAIYKRMYVFEKETFFDCMTTKTGRGSMYQYKPQAGKWQVIYNPSKHGAFCAMVESEKIETLEHYMTK